jgi:hypothetical protein
MMVLPRTVPAFAAKKKAAEAAFLIVAYTR